MPSTIKRRRRAVSTASRRGLPGLSSSSVCYFPAYPSYSVIIVTYCFPSFLNLAHIHDIFGKEFGRPPD